MANDKTKSPHEFYLSGKKETLIAILLVSTPLPQQGDSPCEQYFSDREDNIIVHYQPFYPLTPWQGKSPRVLYLSDKEETLIAILLVNPPSPRRGYFPREQYISDKE